MPQVTKSLLILKIRQEKRAQRLTFWVRRPPGGVGVFHVKGWWPKSSCSPSKVCLPWVSKRGISDIPGILPGCPGSLGAQRFSNMPSVKWLLGFAKVPYQGRPLAPPQGHEECPNIIQKRRTRYHPRGTSWWRTCEGTLRLCRGTVPGAPPSPYTWPQECPKILLKNRTWYQTQKHVCAKARLRNPEGCSTSSCKKSSCAFFVP